MHTTTAPDTLLLCGRQRRQCASVGPNDGRKKHSITNVHLVGVHTTRLAERRVSRCLRTLHAAASIKKKGEKNQMMSQKKKKTKTEIRDRVCAYVRPVPSISSAPCTFEPELRHLSLDSQVSDLASGTCQRTFLARLASSVFVSSIFFLRLLIISSPPSPPPLLQCSIWLAGSRAAAQTDAWL